MIKKILILLAFLSFPIFSYYDEIDQIKKSIVFIGSLDTNRNVNICATGFLVKIKGIYHLITAKHVVMEFAENKFTGKMIDDNYYAFFNTKKNVVKCISFKNVKIHFNVNWMFHKIEYVDLAIIPFPIENEDDLKVIPSSLFLKAEFNF